MAAAQRMSVSIDGATRYDVAISTGRDGYGTRGMFHPTRRCRTIFCSSAADRANHHRDVQPRP
jgi:hypothetical protein